MPPLCRRGRAVAAWFALAALAAGCSAPPPQSTPTPSATLTPTPPPTPRPTPDTESVTVVATGVGTYLLATIPVAVLRNDAGAHAASAVVVHFVTHRAGHQLGSLDAVAVNLIAGETLAVTADCTDACNGADGVDASVTVGSWLNTGRITLSGSGAAYHCGTCRAGHGYGSVAGMLTTTGLAPGAAVAAFAVCENGSGAILGGGSIQLVWQGGASTSIDVPVIIDDQPAKCDLGASTGW